MRNIRIYHGLAFLLLVVLPSLLPAQQMVRKSESTEQVQSTYLLGRTGADTLVGNAIEEGADVNVEMYPSGTSTIVKVGA